MNNLNKEQQLEVLTKKYLELVDEVARDLYYDKNLPENMDPFDYLLEKNPEKATELMDAFRILRAISELNLKEDE